MIRKLEYYLVDVFTEKPFGGNQLAVFTDAAGVSAELMQKIAGELKLSETTFVLPPENEKNDYRVRIFTPAVELPMAGHPTIGTVFVLTLHKVFPNAYVAELISEQGLEMGRPSFITIKIEQPGGEITNVKVGGKCCFIGGELF